MSKNNSLLIVLIKILEMRFLKKRKSNYIIKNK